MDHIYRRRRRRWIGLDCTLTLTLTFITGSQQNRQPGRQNSDKTGADEHLEIISIVIIIRVVVVVVGNSGDANLSAWHQSGGQNGRRSDCNSFVCCELPELTLSFYLTARPTNQAAFASPNQNGKQQQQRQAR